ncbi:MAG: phytanoyl-CoA dioxygenase family protein [Betaproteobacteria bacterium]|jgi:hypothetical protein
MKAFLSLIRKLRDVTYLLSGIAAFVVSKQTPPFAYQALIRLFCQTGGRANDILSSFISRISPPLDLASANGILGNLQPKEIDEIVRVLKTDGYYLFPHKLPEAACARLVKYAKSTECLVRPTEEESSHGAFSERAVYDPLQPRGIRYDFTQQQVINIPEVQSVLADWSVLALAQSYLGACPVADVASMWWHTAYSDQPDAKAAQFYHFDMDRIRWLKIFIYLTDVGPDNGPHCFIKGSHRTGGIPSSLLSRGYVRLTDDDVLLHYPPEQLIEFNAPAGTIILEDTRGLHKGKALTSGDRLMLQLQFSNSLFGGYYPPSRFENISSPSLAEMVRKHPSIYANYLN